MGLGAVLRPSIHSAQAENLYPAKRLATISAMREYIATLEGLDDGAIEEVTTDGLANPANRRNQQAARQSARTFQGQRGQNTAVAALAERRARVADAMAAIRANPNQASARRLSALQNQLKALNNAMQVVSNAGTRANTLQRAGASFRGVSIIEHS